MCRTLVQAGETTLHRSVAATVDQGGRIARKVEASLRSEMVELISGHASWRKVIHT